MAVESGYWKHLRAALAAGELGALDLALARFLHQQSPTADASALTLAALASRRLGGGHSCLDLTGLEAPSDDAALMGPLLADSTLATRQQCLLASGFCSDAGNDDGTSPLLLAGTRLYLRRYWNHERHIAADIAARANNVLPTAVGVSEEMNRLFPSSTALDWQKVAGAIALRSAFTIITGGPGTGKTTTVVRLLGLLQTLQQRDGATRPLRIRLAAPTGKAAARLNDSIAQQIAKLDVDDSIRATIPAEVSTLHRLLGSRPDTRRYRHDRANPLHVDVLVIDEASMVDLEMMAAVLAALPAQARLILLGDKDQLASVEAGAVLGDLCARADGGHYDPATAAWVEQVGAGDIRPWLTDDATPLDQSIVMLRHSHRFEAAGGIGRLASAVNRGDVTDTLAQLDGRHANLHWIAAATPEQIIEFAIDGDPRHQSAGYGALIERIQAGHGDQSADAWARSLIAELSAFQLLCALREGPYGVAGINAAISARLLQRRLIHGGHEGFAGRPVMITRNDYALGLMNGDVGLTLAMPDDAGQLRLRVAFLVAGERGEGSRLRLVAPSRLAHVETAFAMTVHKSQGSEFGHCAVVLPDRLSPALSRELLYTGITRARERVTLFGSAAAISHAVSTPTRRNSGLFA